MKLDIDNELRDATDGLNPRHRKEKNIVIHAIAGRDLSDEKCREIAEVYTSNGWGQKYPDEDIRRLYANSTYALCHTDADGEVVAVLRALSDNQATTWLAELVVKRGYDYSSIAPLLLEKFSQDFRHTAIYTELLTGYDDQSLYERFGMVPREMLLACSRKPLS